VAPKKLLAMKEGDFPPMLVNIHDFTQGAKHGCRNIALTLIDPQKGEQTAQSCVNARFRQLSGTVAKAIGPARTSPKF